MHSVLTLSDRTILSLCLFQRCEESFLPIEKQTKIQVKTNHEYVM